MLATTLRHLRCPGQLEKPCAGTLRLQSLRSFPWGATEEVVSGQIHCEVCAGEYPIIAGVAILVSNSGDYLIEHVKGIAARAEDTEIPKRYRRAYLEAKNEIETEHIEDDLEAERINSLYVMNHYLSTGNENTQGAWWEPISGHGSPAISGLIHDFWDQGPLRRIGERLQTMPQDSTLIELGCGNGGLLSRTRRRLGSYLGIDSSFAGIVLARHLALGCPFRGEIKIPEDLFNGPVSRKLEFNIPQFRDAGFDFIVGDITAPPVLENAWDFSAALNVIDMLEDPSELPRLQRSLLKKGGVAIQSCPYIWHPSVAQLLRKNLKGVQDSAEAVRKLYEDSGFQIQSEDLHVPWIFFKHVRQVELYSVHLFFASRANG